MIETPHVPPLTDRQLADLQRHLLVETAARPPRRVARRRLLALGTVATAAVAAFVAFSSGGGGGSAAFAGWTAVPAAGTPAQTAHEVALCRADETDQPGENVVVSERRGPFAFLVFASAGVSSYCLLQNPDDAGTAARDGGGKAPMPPTRADSSARRGASSM